METGMIKSTKKKSLRLDSQTIRPLDRLDLRPAAGGTAGLSYAKSIITCCIPPE
jgi:hypothetical protein